MPRRKPGASSLDESWIARLAPAFVALPLAGDDRLCLGGGAVPVGQREASLDQVTGHRRAHDAEAEEVEFGHGGLIKLCRRQLWLKKTHNVDMRDCIGSKNFFQRARRSTLNHVLEWIGQSNR